VTDGARFCLHLHLAWRLKPCALSAVCVCVCVCVFCHTQTSLRDKCLSYVLQHFDSVTKTAAFEEMGRANLEREWPPHTHTHTSS
jgi:hypothetical protein